MTVRNPLWGPHCKTPIIHIISNAYCVNAHVTNNSECGTKKKEERRRYIETLRIHLERDYCVSA